MKRLATLFITVLLAAVAAMPLSAQSRTVSGKVSDGSGEDQFILVSSYEYYEPGALVGKTASVIVNLLLRAMLGIDSCGMLISAVHHENGEEKLHLLMVDPHIPAGAKLY